MKKTKLLLIFLVNIFVIFSFFTSCEVGLGDSVDTEVPEIDISSPPADSIIRSSFALKGSWSDDGGVDNVKVTLKNLDTKKEYGPFSAELSNIQELETGEKGNWLCTINPKESNSPIPDGNYEATVVVEDKSKRTNKLYRQFSLDNTPPVVILERPGSKAANESVMDIYGQIVTLQGMASDDHNVEKIEIQVFEDNQYTNLLKTIELKNVPPTINLEIASFKEGETNTYYEIYGSTSVLPDSAKKRYCKIVSYDGAVSYPADGSDQKDEDKVGNKTEIYYLKDEVSSAGILTDSCKITDIYHIFNQTKTDEADVVKNLKAYEITQGVFTLNPKNNPTFAVSLNEEKKMYEGSPLTIEVTAGLDGYGLILSSLRPYLIDITTGEKIYIEDPITTEGTQSTYKWNSTISSSKGVVNGKQYKIGVDGTDEVVGNSIEAAAGPYIFTFDTKAKVKLENIKVEVNGTNVSSENLYYIPTKKPGVTPEEYSNVTISGSLVTTAGNGLIDVVIDEIRKTRITLTDNHKDPTWDPDTHNGEIKYNFTTTLATSALGLTDGEHTLKIKGINGEAENIYQKQIITDGVAPTIKTFTLSPTTKKYTDNKEDGPNASDYDYINGKVKLTLDIIDETSQVQEFTVTLKNNTTNAVIGTPITKTSGFNGYELEINSKDLNDEEQLSITVETKDKTGNIKTETKTFIVNQDTDKPVVQPLKPAETTMLFASETAIKGAVKDDTTGKRKSHIDIGNMLSLIAYDDDGINTIKAKFYDKNNVLVSEADRTAGGNTEYPFDLSVPNTAGIYKVELTIKDIKTPADASNPPVSKTYNFYIRVVSTKPVVSLDKKGVNYVKTGAHTDKLDVEVFINSDNPSFKLERKLKNSTGEVTEYAATFKDDTPASDFADVAKLSNDAPTVTDSIIFNKILSGNGNTKKLASGKYTLSYVATDGGGSGNASEETTIDFYVDNEAPAVSFTNAELTPENSEIGSYKFQGTMNDGDSSVGYQSGIDKVTYTVSKGGVNKVTGTAGGSKTEWNTTLSFNTWEEGEYTITVNAVDKVGNASESSSQTFWYDKSAPTATVDYFVSKDAAHSISNKDKFYYNDDVTLYGTAADTNGIKTITLKQDEQNIIIYSSDAAVTADGNSTYNSTTGEWTVSALPRALTPAAKEYIYVLEVEDVSGKKTTTSAKTLGVDKKEPTVTINSPANNSVLAGANFTFKATPNDVADDDNVASGVVSLTYKVYTKASDGTLTAYGANYSVTEDAESNREIEEIKLLGTGHDEANKTVDLLEGHYVIEVTAKDTAGNVTSTPATVEFFVDQSKPVLSVEPVSPVGLNKLKAGDTEKVEITVTGKISESNKLKSFVAYRSDDTSKAHPITITASDNPDNETWTFKDSIAKSTKDGKYTYTITATDIANQKTDITCDVIIDTIAPVVDVSKITVPTKEQTENKSFRFEGAESCITDASPEYELSEVHFIFADSKPAASATPQFTATPGSKNGKWSSTQTFEKYTYFNTEGSKKLWIKAYDKAENSSDWVSKDFVYDTAVPEISETTINTDNKTQNANFTLGGSVSDNYGITSVTANAVCTDTGKSANNRDISVTYDSSNSTWEAVVAKSDLNDGNYDVTVTATDNSGKTNTVTRKIVVDTIAPVINTSDITSTTTTASDKVTFPSNAAVRANEVWYKTRTVQLSVIATDATSGIKSVAYSTNRASGGWSELTKQEDEKTFTGAVTFTADGTNYLYFRAEDNAGNIVGESSDFCKTTYNIDTTAPINLKVYKVATGGTALSGEVVVPKKDATYYLEATDAAVGVKGFKFGNISATLPNGATRYSITIPADSIVTGDVRFTVEDLLGNEASYSPFRFKVDEAAPSITINSPGEGAKLNGNITISGSISDSLKSSSKNDGRVEKIELFYSLDNGTTYLPYDSTDTKSGLTNSNETFSVTHQFSSFTKMIQATTGNTKLELVADTAQSIIETQAVILKVVATDQAGNIAETTRSFTVDRNTDRPVITFTTVDLTDSMKSGSEAWLKTTTTLVGTVSDDDGITDGSTSMSISNNGTNWNAVNVSNGSWSFDIKTLTNNNEDQANKAHTLYFKVTDKEGSTFVSKANSDLASVKLKGNDSKEYGNSTNKDSRLFLKVDTKNPTVNITSFDSTTLGGSKRQFEITFTATDGNGIKNVSGVAKFDFDQTCEVTAACESVETNTYKATFTVDLADKHKAADGKDGVLSIRISAEDNAENESFQTRTLKFDYKKPEIKVLKPSSTVPSSGSVNAYGTVSETVTLQYALSTSKEKKPGSAVTSWTGKNPDTDATAGGTITSYTPAYADLDSSLTWFLYLDGESGDGHITTLKNFITTTTGITTAEKIASQGDDKFINIVNVYLWLKATDENGNITEMCSCIPFDPQGERPTVSISAPDAGEKVGSTVSVYGVAEPKLQNTMKNVWLQIVSNYHKELKDSTGNVVFNPTTPARSYGTASTTNFSVTADDLNYLKAAGYDVRKFKAGTGYDSVWDGSGTASDYAIKIPTNGSTAWSTTINNNREFDYVSTGADDTSRTVNVALRVFAEDDKGNISAKETRCVEFDANSAVITDIYYRQKTSDSATSYSSSKIYTNTTYISCAATDQWYLTFVAKDEGTRLDVTIKEKGDTTDITSGFKCISTDTTNGTQKTMEFKLPASYKATDYVGEHTYIISAYDGENTTKKEVVVNIDNKKPAVSGLNATYKNVKQKNGFYKISSQAKEDSIGAVNQSGVNFVAFYFKRGNSVYDVMWNKKNSYDVNGKTAAEGLFWKSCAVSSVTQNTITLSSSDVNIHTGGLVKIGGVIYVIKGVDNNAGAKVITLTDRIDATQTYSTAEFAVATVVNNTIQEVGGTDKYKAVTDKPNYAYGYYKEPEIDDGDSVIEYLSSDGTWEASINSLNIPDGEIEIHYVAFDKAGNFQDVTVTGANVCNNAPRLAGVVIKTDYNGDGAFEGDGEVIETYNAASNTETAKSRTGTIIKGSKEVKVYDPDPDRTGLDVTWKELSAEPMVVGSSTAGALIMKGKTEIHPEIVGGTGAVIYSYVDSKKTGATGLEGSNATAIINEGTDDYTINNLDKPIVIQVGDLLKAGEWEKTSPDLIKFTFKDSANQTAELHLYAGINIIPATPEVKINPFHWTSFADNSIYGSNSDTTLETLKGHIELEEHWKLSDGYLKDGSGNTKATKDTSGEYDDDPKVSGKIVITGTAKDKVRINKLYFCLPGMETELGTGNGKAGLTAVTIGGKSYFCLAEVPSGESVIQPKDFWSVTTKDADEKDVVTETHGVKLEFTKNEYSEEGHYIEWKLSWNTAKISTVAANDVEVKVVAENCGTPTYATSGTDADIGLDGKTKYSYGVENNSVGQNTPGSTQTNGTTKTARYRMDIVPYITSLTTSLATDAKHPSIYSRTALGKYPVYYYTTTPAGGKNSGETYTINGFNLTTTSQTTGASSAAIELTVNTNVKTLNNKNNNNAPYNKQPNSVNNNWLTDDVETVVWNINSRAKTSGKGSLTETKMHVDGSGALGYSYIHKGAMYFNLAGTNSGVATSTYSTVDFIYDRNGKAFGTYAETDFQSTTDAGHFKLAYETWGAPDKDGEHGTTIALESMTYDTKSTPKRFEAPKLAASTIQDALYMLYYDTVTNSFKYRGGSGYSKTVNTPSFTSGNYTGLTGTTVTNENGAKNISVINSANPGKYYSIAVAKKTNADSTVEDVVVMLWVDGKTNDLWYSYSENPLNVSGTNTPTWKTPVKIVSGIADGVCSIVVDPDNHIHIAAYTTDATGSLLYAYLNAYNTLGNSTTWPAANKVYVDRYGTTGEFLTLEVAKRSASGRYVPFIGYYSNEMPKYAYLVDEASSNGSTNAAQWVPKAGVAGSGGTGTGNYYTKAWEEIIVPTSSPVLANDKNNNINIAVRRNTAADSVGVLQAISNGPAKSANPVLGYGINYAGLGYVETAQIK